MHSLPLPFTILSCFGIWKPREITSGLKNVIYNCLTVCVLTTMYTFVISELIQVIAFFWKYRDISDTLFLLLTTSSVCYKAAAFLIQRKSIFSLEDMLTKDCCRSKNLDELNIQKRFDQVNRIVTVICIFMVYGNVSSMLALPLMDRGVVRKLPFTTWLPYNINNQRNYWLSFVHQGLGLLCCSSVSVANDTIVTGFMMQACAQFEILAYRFRSFPKEIEKARICMSSEQVDKYEKQIIRQFIKHHLHIFKFSNEILNTFSSVILVQFCVSAMVITVSVYQLSIKQPGTFDFVMVFVYLLSMLTEFFLYCWFGNELTLKSINFAMDIYATDWTLLAITTWKQLLFIIRRSTKPTVIHCSNFIILSLDTYVNILRISYSAFNLLRKSTVKEINTE